MALATVLHQQKKSGVESHCSRILGEKPAAQRRAAPGAWPGGVTHRPRQPPPPIQEGRGS